MLAGLSDEERQKLDVRDATHYYYLTQVNVYNSKLWENHFLANAYFIPVEYELKYSEVQICVLKGTVKLK